MKREATNSKIEECLKKLSDIAEEIGDDEINSDLYVLIEDVCKYRDFCLVCYGHIDEAIVDGEYLVSCHCRTMVLGRAV